MKIDGGELRRGLAETRRFVLSHHLPAEFYRCYSPVVFGRRLHVCARCAGVYPGIVAGLLAYGTLFQGEDALLAVAFLPLPALVDWALTTYRDARGYNPVRTVTGALLGCGYGLGIGLVLFDFTAAVLPIGASYAIISAVLIYYSW